MIIRTQVVITCPKHNTVEHSYNKPEIPGQTVCYKQEFVISEQFPMRYCSTWLRSLLCYVKKFAIEEFVIRVFHCIVHASMTIDSLTVSILNTCITNVTISVDFVVEFFVQH